MFPFQVINNQYTHVANSVKISHVVDVVAKVDKVLAVPLAEYGLGVVGQGGRDLHGVSQHARGL